MAYDATTTAYPGAFYPGQVYPGQLAAQPAPTYRSHFIDDRSIRSTVDIPTRKSGGTA